MTLAQLRKKYPEFSYRSYFWEIEDDKFLAGFVFQAGEELVFKPKISISGINQNRLDSIPESVIDNLVFNLGLIEMLSYWKSVCSPNITLECGHFCKAQELWWIDLIEQGMGQFFYENKIDFDKKSFVKFRYKKSEGSIFTESLAEKYLVAIGGGKDSSVSVELLSQAKLPITAFMLNPIAPALETARTAGITEQIIVNRELDQTMLNLNRKGYLNGHTPFSAYLAFLSVLLGVLLDYKHLVFSNELSANEETLIWKGKKINHQYSKTFRFEKKFREYCIKYLAKDANYFSFLRPLHELQIAKIFSKFDKYFSVILSCNVGQQSFSGTKTPTIRWCQKCSKCLFAYIMLYPFLGREKIKTIFSENLFENLSLKKTMEELLGIGGKKPLECVGTRKETLAALYMSVQSERVALQELPPLLKYFESKILPKFKYNGKKEERDLFVWNNDNFVPENLANILKEKAL